MLKLILLLPTWGSCKQLLSRIISSFASLCFLPNIFPSRGCFWVSINLTGKSSNDNASICKSREYCQSFRKEHTEFCCVKYFWLRRRSPTSPNVCLSVCGQPENLLSYILLQHPECSRMFQNACKMFQNACRMFQNVPECSRMHAEWSRMFQNLLESSRMHAECSSMF